MPNSYTAVPNVIPGNLTVSGNLQVGGGKIEVGTIHPNLIIASDVNHIGYFGSNYDGSAGSRQNGGTPALALVLDQANGKPVLRRFNAAGTSRDEALSDTIFSQSSVVSNTGNTTENTIYTVPVRGNTLGLNAGVLLRFICLATVQGATPATLRFKFGGSTILAFSITVVQNMLCDLYIWNDAATNNQRTHVVMVPNTGSPVVSFTTTAIDTTADQNIVITSQCGLTTDAQAFRSAYAQQIASFAPVAA